MVVVLASEMVAGALEDTDHKRTLCVKLLSNRAAFVFPGCGRKVQCRNQVKARGLAKKRIRLYFAGVSTLYVKATLCFPSRDLLWMFAQQTQGFNLHLSPKQNTLSGMFEEKELEIAAKQFKANYTEKDRVTMEHYVPPASSNFSSEQDRKKGIA